MPAVSILIAAFNAESTLDRCLDSLVQQTMTDFQAICVDDCSSDHTLALLRRRAAADPRILVLQTPHNSGHAVARNLALQHVEAPLVTMLDADDWFSPDALVSALKVFREHPLTDSVVFHLRYHDAATGAEHDFGLPAELASGGALSGLEACKLSLNRWQLHGLYVTRTSLHRRFPYDTSCRLYSDENTTHLHYLHSREVRSCEGVYFYYRHPAAQTAQFSVRRFDVIDANFSLLLSLKHEGLSPDIIKRYEVIRWENFLGCYRLFLRHKDTLSPEQCRDIQQRLTTILHTFRPSRLPLRARWKPGYLLTLNAPLFDLQQRLYVLFRH